MEGADNQGMIEQSRPVRQNNYGIIPRSQFYRGPPLQTQPREDSNEENKENQDETQDQQPLQPWYCLNLNY